VAGLKLVTPAYWACLLKHALRLFARLYSIPYSGTGRRRGGPCRRFLTRHVCGQPGQLQRCWLGASFGPPLLLQQRHVRHEMQKQKALPSNAAALLCCAACGRAEAWHPATHLHAALCWRRQTSVQAVAGTTVFKLTAEEGVALLWCGEPELTAIDCALSDRL